MAESMQSLFRRGLISPRSMSKLTRNFRTGRDDAGVPTEMTDFNDETKDEGSIHQTGEVPDDEINHPTNQKKKKIGQVSKGGGAGREEQLEADHIDDARMQQPTFPHGGKFHPGEARRRVGVAGPARGANGSAGVLYGGPNSRKYG
jgi:hypothetical protein